MPKDINNELLYCADLLEAVFTDQIPKIKIQLTISLEKYTHLYKDANIDDPLVKIILKVNSTTLVENIIIAVLK
jgi:hypothetical protein